MNPKHGLALFAMKGLSANVPYLSNALSTSVVDGSTKSQTYNLYPRAEESYSQSFGSRLPLATRCLGPLRERERDRGESLRGPRKSWRLGLPLFERLRLRLAEPERLRDLLLLRELERGILTEITVTLYTCHVTQREQKNLLVTIAIVQHLNEIRLTPLKGHITCRNLQVICCHYLCSIGKICYGKYNETADTLPANSCDSFSFE